MPHDVFISYSSQDKAVADATCAALEAQKIRCWIAPRDVLPGTEYGEAILAAIEACRAMVLVFSGHANRSPHVRREVERAVSKGKFILPFRIENVLPSLALEYCLSNTHWLDALTPPIERRIAELAAAVSSLLNKDTLQKPSRQMVAHRLAIALQFGYRISGIEWAAKLRNGGLPAATCDPMIHSQWARAKLISDELGLRQSLDVGRAIEEVIRIENEIALLTEIEPAFRIGRVVGATYFGAVNQALALAHTGRTVDPMFLSLPGEALKRIRDEILPGISQIEPSALGPLERLWGDLVQSAQSGNPDINAAEARMERALTETCQLIETAN